VPYTVRQRGKKWQIVRKADGTVVGTSTSKQKAQASVRARMAGEKKK
jgi:hypothetical protein